METIEKNYGAEEWRAPVLEENDTVIFSECGRVLENIDYRSHYFRLVKEEFGSLALLVKHGGGQERINEHFLRKIIPGLNCLDSDCRYLMLYAVYRAYHEGNKRGTDATAERYRVAFVQGRLKKRKVRNSAAVKVWIEPTKNGGAL